ncbi:MAG TPA: lipopolysaccharide assembly protein LapA domain-containing protein [Thermoleophilia bacterium]|nr:lipopolysaccharide assembly protein LapA domain-containing protein [Thermoleophilia bacterium]
MRVFLAIMVILLILLLVFAVQNPGSTEVAFLTFSSTVSLLLIILVSVVVGLLLGLAVVLPGNLRRSSRVRKLESEAGQLRSQSADMVAAMAKGRSERADPERAASARAASDTMDAERTDSRSDASAKES